MPSSLLERRRMEERYFTPKEVAARLQVTEKTLRTWISQKKLRAVRVGRFWRISESALRSFLRESGEEESGGRPDATPAE
jgi:excisionase family DNA binding protein